MALPKSYKIVPTCATCSHMYHDYIGGVIKIMRCDRDTRKRKPGFVNLNGLCDKWEQKKGAK